jgi:hypothetical protein
VNTEEFCGPGFESGADPLWIDLLEQHMITPFHAMVGGGDQIYCDVYEESPSVCLKRSLKFISSRLMREPELQEWINLKSNSAKVKYPMTDEVFQAIDRFVLPSSVLIHLLIVDLPADSTSTIIVKCSSMAHSPRRTHRCTYCSLLSTVLSV